MHQERGQTELFLPLQAGGVTATLAAPRNQKKNCRNQVGRQKMEDGDGWTQPISSRTRLRPSAPPALQLLLLLSACRGQQWDEKHQ